MYHEHRLLSQIYAKHNSVVPKYTQGIKMNDFSRHCGVDVTKWTASSEFGTYSLCEQWVKRNLQTES